MFIFRSMYNEMMREIEELRRINQYIDDNEKVSMLTDFDFEGKNAFSIERELETSKTVIGYQRKLPEGYKDSYFYCRTTNDIHNELVEKFRKSLSFESKRRMLKDIANLSQNLQEERDEHIATKLRLEDYVKAYDVIKDEMEALKKELCTCNVQYVETQLSLPQD